MQPRLCRSAGWQPAAFRPCGEYPLYDLNLRLKISSQQAAANCAQSPLRVGAACARQNE